MKLFLLLLSSFCFVIQVQSQTIITATGTPSGTRGGDGGPFSKATFYYPEHFTYDKAGNLYISSSYDHTIRKVDAVSGIITTFLSLQYPEAIAFDKQEKFMYISASTCIYQYNMATKALLLFAGIPGSPCQFTNCGEGVPALAAQLDQATGIAVDSLGNVYVADQDDTRIRRIDITTRIITTYAGGGACNCSGLGDGGPANKADLLFPWDIVFDSKGDLIISDLGLHNIRKVNSKTGIITTIAGSAYGGGWGYSGDGGAAVNAKFNSPTGLFIDKDDNLYIADRSNHVIRKIDKAGIITTVAGNGTHGYSGDCGPTNKAQLNYPRHVIVEPNGGLLIADIGNHVIRELINSAPNVITTSLKSICVNSTIALKNSAQGGVWQSSDLAIATVNADGVVTGLSEGKVDISYYISNGCNTNSSTISLTISSVPAIQTIKGGSVVCEGSTISLTNGVAGGVWSSSNSLLASVDATGLVRGVAAGTAIIKYTVSTGQCSNTDSVKIIVNPAPQLPIINGDTSVCVSSRISLTNASAGGTWSINNNGIASINASTGFITGIKAGKAIVSYTVTNGCGTAVASSGLIVNTLSRFSLGKDTSICVNTKLLLAPSGTNLSYLWQDGSTAGSRFVTLPQLYWLKVTDSNSCSFSDTIIIQNQPLPLVQLGNDTILCNDHTLLLSAKGFSIAKYQWNDGSTQPVHSVSKAGRYSVVVTGLNGCTSSDTIKVNYLYSPRVDIGQGGTICSGNPVIIDPHLNNVNYLWQDGSTRPTYTVTDAGKYSLTASNFCGSSTANVEFKKGLCSLLMPTAFTPNADGLNDVFRVKYVGFIKSFHFTIFNRWGEKVFETTDPVQGWNGKYKSLDQDSGNYTWTITFTNFEGNTENAKGSVLLIR